MVRQIHHNIMLMVLAVTLLVVDYAIRMHHTLALVHLNGILRGIRSQIEMVFVYEHSPYSEQRVAFLVRE